jgi:hypothetical protein
MSARDMYRYSRIEICCGERTTRKFSFTVSIDCIVFVSEASIFP